MEVGLVVVVVVGVVLAAAAVEYLAGHRQEMVLELELARVAVEHSVHLHGTVLRVAVVAYDSFDAEEYCSLVRLPVAVVVEVEVPPNL